MDQSTENLQYPYFYSFYKKDMPPERMIQNSILHEINRWGEIITKQKELCPTMDDKNKWGFMNEFDWRYGHFVGMIEGLAVLYHHVTHHRQITPEELRDIEDFIKENTKNMRDYFNSKK